MSALDVAGAFACCVTLALIAGAAAISDVLADFFAAKDRREHIAECSAYGGKLAVVPPPPSLESIRACEEIFAADSSYAAELERMRDGAAFAEAMACTLADIRDLPEAPTARSRWS